MAALEGLFWPCQALFSPSIVHCGWSRPRSKDNGQCLAPPAPHWWCNRLVQLVDFCEKAHCQVSREPIAPPKVRLWSRVLSVVFAPVSPVSGMHSGCMVNGLLRTQRRCRKAPSWWCSLQSNSFNSNSIIRISWVFLRVHSLGNSPFLSKMSLTKTLASAALGFISFVSDTIARFLKSSLVLSLQRLL